MDMQGEYRIPAPRETVWDALNDPEVLKACITGCQELNPTEDGGFEAKVKAKVGPVSATFSGVVKLENVNAPESYTIVGEGKGGAAGFAKGGADVSLAEDGGETVLTYTVNAQVGGKLAQIGGRLIDSTSKKYANEFFTKFVEIVSERADSDAPAAESPEESPSSAQEEAPSEAPSEAPHPSVYDDPPESTAQEDAARAAIEAVDTHGPKPVVKPFQWIMLLVILLAGLALFFGGEPPPGN